MIPDRGHLVGRFGPPCPHSVTIDSFRGNQKPPQLKEMVCSVLRRHRSTDDCVIGLRFARSPGARRAVTADQPDKPAELPIDRGLMQRLSNFTLKDVNDRAERTRSTAIRAGRRSCSFSWEPTARSATSTCRG